MEQTTTTTSTPINLARHQNACPATAPRITGPARADVIRWFGEGHSVGKVFELAYAAGHGISYSSIRNFRQALGLAVDLMQHELADPAALRGHMVLRAGEVVEIRASAFANVTEVR